ncbi:MAG: hypothetical protein ACI8WY_003932, partial [Planctomycetota bacterium]
MDGQEGTFLPTSKIEVRVRVAKTWP